MSDTYTGPTNVAPENEYEARLIARAEAQGIERASLTRDPWGELWIAGELPLCHAVDNDDPAPHAGAGAARQVIAKHDGWLDMTPGSIYGEIRVMTGAGAGTVLQRETVPMTAHMLCGPGEFVEAGDVIAEVAS